MKDVAVGTKIFTRADRLKSLLKSIERTGISKVYVADDGESTAEKQAIYGGEYPFELVVLDLEYDAGLGYGRHAIVQEMDEEYLLIVDTDHQIPENVSILREQLEARPDVGGIAGTLIEPEKGRMFQSAKDLYQEGNVLVRSADVEPKTVEYVSDHAFVEFDFIPNAAMFRKECVTDYCWDPNYVIGKEHIDFYVGHWKNTDWKFGVCPEVFFRHFPGGKGDYTDHRHSSKKNERSDEYFREKWGYRYVRTDRGYWFDTQPIDNPSETEKAIRVLKEQGPLALLGKSVRKLPHLVHRRFSE